MTTTQRLDRPVRRAPAAKAMGITRQGLHAWISRLITEPIHRAGREPPESLSLQQVWSIAIARVVRQQGESQEAASNVYAFLSGLEPEAIEQVFAQGRNCVYVICGNVVDELLLREVIRSQAVQFD